MHMYDVVVVGAGISGLTAAHHLLSMAPHLNLIVLEAKDRVGGRTLTTDLQTIDGTDRWDLGGQWVSTAQPRIMDLLAELGLDTYPQYHNGIKLLQLSDGAIRKYTGSIPKLSWLSLLDMRWFVYKLDKLCNELDVDDPYSHPKARELDSKTVETYMSENLYTKDTKEAFVVAIRATLGVDPIRMSMLYCATKVKSAGCCGFLGILKIAKESLPDLNVKGGTQQISEGLMTKIGRHNVKLSSPVKSIRETKDVMGSGVMEVTTEIGETISTKYVIMAIPLQLVGDIDIIPPLPEKRKVLFSSMPMGHLTKYICTYETAFWRTRGYSGEIVSSGGKRTSSDCDTGPLGIVYDSTTYKGSPALVGFLGGNQGTQWTSKPYEMRKFAILKALSECFGEEALSPIEFAEKIWSSEPYTGGCPVNFAAPGVMQHMSSNFRNPFGRIHWAGTETATAWCGYMDGAVQSGRRAAKEVLYHLNPEIPRPADTYDTRDRQRRNPAGTSGFLSTLGVLYPIVVAVFGALVFFIMIKAVK